MSETRNLQCRRHLSGSRERDIAVESAKLDVVEKHAHVLVSDVEECRVEILVEEEPGKQ